MKPETPSERRHREAVECFIENGFVEMGETASQTIRIGSASSPIVGHGKSGGTLSRIGGRLRLGIEGSGLRVTVGLRTTCVYEIQDGGRQPTYLATFNTSEIDVVRSWATGEIARMARETTGASSIPLQGRK